MSKSAPFPAGGTTDLIKEEKANQLCIPDKAPVESPLEDYWSRTSRLTITVEDANEEDCTPGESAATAGDATAGADAFGNGIPAGSLGDSYHKVKKSATRRGARGKPDRPSQQKRREEEHRPEMLEGSVPQSSHLQMCHNELHSPHQGAAYLEEEQQEEFAPTHVAQPQATPACKYSHDNMHATIDRDPVRKENANRQCIPDVTPVERSREAVRTGNSGLPMAIEDATAEEFTAGMSAATVGDATAAADALGDDTPADSFGDLCQVLKKKATRRGTRGAPDRPSQQKRREAHLRKVLEAGPLSIDVHMLHGEVLPHHDSGADLEPRFVNLVTSDGNQGEKPQLAMTTCISSARSTRRDSTMDASKGCPVHVDLR